VRAAVTQGKGEPLVIERIDDPTPDADQLLVAVKASGICGSDLHIADNREMPGRVLGHEMAGEIVGFGSAVEGYKEGDRIAVFPLNGCGECMYCLTGRTSRCSQRTLTGGQLNGGYAEYVTISPRQAYKLPADVSYAFGAAVEPLSVAHHAWEKTRAETGEPVLVVGGGPVGQAVALWARHYGASDVVVSDLVEHRRALARQAGATATIDASSQDVVEAFREITGQAPRVVIECVGVPGMIQRALETASVDGSVTIVGMTMGPDQFLPSTPFSKELNIQFVSFYRGSDYDTTIRALDRGGIDPTPLLTDHISLDDLPVRFEALKHPTTECKIIVEP
jgi:threonine dehydrogenase-like Zn-dependent dehydrogenase